MSGTRIKTNLKTNEQIIKQGFGLIDSWKVIRNTKSERMSELQITLSDWVFNAVLGREVLTLHRDYFRLRKPLERRIYELARKHCGKKDEFTISLDVLKKKCGSASEDPEFRRLVRVICDEDAEHGHMPDYAVMLNGDMRFLNRGTMKPLPSSDTTVFPVLDPETYNDARIVAPGYDVYHLEQEWRNYWIESGKPELKSADAAFLGFCKHRHEHAPTRRDTNWD